VWSLPGESHGDRGKGEEGRNGLEFPRRSTVLVMFCVNSTGSGGLTKLYQTPILLTIPDCVEVLDRARDRETTRTDLGTRGECSSSRNHHERNVSLGVGKWWVKELI